MVNLNASILDLLSSCLFLICANLFPRGSRDACVPRWDDHQALGEDVEAKHHPAQGHQVG
jgi:hypothetical protein